MLSDGDADEQSSDARQRSHRQSFHLGASVPTWNFFRMLIIGHQLVNADCSKFAPTNAVNQYHRPSTKLAKATLNNTKNPAIKRR
jgi:hypothetical protein